MVHAGDVINFRCRTARRIKPKTSCLGNAVKGATAGCRVQGTRQGMSRGTVGGLAARTSPAVPRCSSCSVACCACCGDNKSALPENDKAPWVGTGGKNKDRRVSSLAVVTCSCDRTLAACHAVRASALDIPRRAFRAASASAAAAPAPSAMPTNDRSMEPSIWL